PQRHVLAQAQSSSQSCLPLLHPCHRNHHLGRQKLQIAPHLPLQAHEGSQSRQADEVRLGNPPARILGEKIRQAPHPKTRRPPRTHPPRLHQRRRLSPRSVPRRRHHAPYRLPPPPTRSRLRAPPRLPH